MIAKALGVETAVKAALVARPVTQLMQERCIIAFLVLEGFKGRHLYKVFARCVKSAVSAVANICACLGNKPFCMFQPFRQRQRVLRLAVVMDWQAFHLLHVKHGISFHKRNLFLDFFALVACLRAGQFIGINHKGAFLAFSHVSTKLLRLLISNPDRRGIAFLDGFPPEQQNIHALIGDAVMPQGAGYSPRRMRGAPRLHPSTDSALKVGNNAVGYAAVNVFTVVCHGGSLPYAACAVSITSTKPTAPPA